MGNQLQNLDYLVFLAYFLIVAGYGYWIYQRKKSANASATDFFLAEGALTWWAIGASLIASNISAEQFIGMSGSGFAMGLAIASYEWMAAATLLVVAVFFMPGYITNRIFTMPQFLEKRYSPLVATMMAVFWLLVYVFVNLTSILYLGAIAVSTISGFSFTACAVFLAVFAIIITLGGMKVIGYTDVIQVAILVLGGLATTYLALDLVAQQFGSQGMWTGLGLLRQQAPEHFHMIFDESNPHYKDLPGLTVLVGAMWIANLNYWGCNQYIIQRALAAKNLNEAQRGVAFAAYLKLLLPLIVVIPGICAYVLKAPIGKADEAYPWLLNAFVGPGLKGLAFAALVAAIVSSLASMMNSASTIFTMDLYQHLLRKQAGDRELVLTGRIASFAAIFIAALIAPMLVNLEQGFQFIQDFTGLISPGVVAIFVMGLFWKRASAFAALVAAVSSIPLSLLINRVLPGIPFIDRMGLVFLILCAAIVVISLTVKGRAETDKGIELEGGTFRSDRVFNVLAIGVLGITAALYALFW
ncbi:MAG: sodium/sugar symporter [Bacteroidia bacterium]|nr:sodium/sugar symporter [Bacteroidia bacterium]